MRPMQNNTGNTEQNSANCLRTQKGSFPAKFKAMNNEIRQRKTLFRCYKDILLTWNKKI